MPAPRKYPEELRERAIRMTMDARKDPASRPGACARIGDQVGTNPETLRGWVTQAEVDACGRPGTTTTDAAKASRAGEGESRVAPIKRDLAFRFGFLCGGARARLPPRSLTTSSGTRTSIGVESICTTLTSADVPIAPSAFYAARTRPPVGTGSWRRGTQARDRAGPQGELRRLRHPEDARRADECVSSLWGQMGLSSSN